jgi:cytoskeleton protein RodZ
MAGFGQELRLERERRGVSLATMCAATKVKPYHFEALEQEDYLQLPGGVFRRGIVRAYLAFVGLDEPTWMPRFDASFAERVGSLGQPPDVQDAVWEQFAENVRRSRNQRGESTRLRWLGVLLMLALVVSAGWAVWQYLLHGRLPL